MIESGKRLTEEMANSASHGFALLAALISVPFLIAASSKFGIASIVGTSIFSATMILLFLTSTLYHALPTSRAKDFVLKLDYGAIYFFIAGSYTPFALNSLNDTWSWTLFFLVWFIAILGASLKAFDLLSHPRISTGIYLIMGWIVLIATIPLAEHMPSKINVLLLAGGFAYSVGVVFFMMDSRFRFSHAVWHCFVILGTVCHYFAVLNYASCACQNSFFTPAV
jgi:hemolysin III